MDNIDMNSKKEKFYMAVFMVSYIGIYLTIFFWLMCGIAMVCREGNGNFRVWVLVVAAVDLVFFYFRTRFLTIIDGIAAAGTAAAALSTAFMGQGSGEWLLRPEFMIDLGILTISFFIMMVSVMIHESRLLGKAGFFDGEPAVPEDLPAAPDEAEGRPDEGGKADDTADTGASEDGDRKE